MKPTANAETFFKVVNVLIQWENVENHRRKYEAGEWYRRSFDWDGVVFGVNTQHTKKGKASPPTPDRPPLKKEAQAEYICVLEFAVVAFQHNFNMNLK